MDLNILIVEDDPQQNRLLQGYVTKLGYTTHGLRTLRETFEYIEKNKTDMIILDLNLPDSVGLDTFRLLQLKAPRIAIMIYTGHGDTSLARDAIRLGASQYMLKMPLAGNLQVLELLILNTRTTHDLNIMQAEREAILQRAIQINQAQLKGIPSVLTACAICGKVKDMGTDKWIEMAQYLEDHNIGLSHAYCPDHMSSEVNKILGE